MNQLVVVKPTFIANPDADLNMSSLQGYVEGPYAELVRLFGEPLENETDGYKVSTIWYFTNEQTGAAIRLYDYKMTDTYDDNTMTVEQFRALPSYQWHIGAHNQKDALEFQEWLLSVVAQRQLPSTAETDKVSPSEVIQGN